MELPMRILVLLALAASLSAAESIQVFGHAWDVPTAADWTISEGAVPELTLLVPRPPTATQIRRPTQFAVAKTADFSKITIEAEAKRLGGSLIIVYAYKDPAHFNYVHFSVDDAMKQPVHNGVFHVFGGERVRISSQAGPGSLPSKDAWYKLRVDYDPSTGEVVATVNGQPNPSLRAVDLSLGTGRVGIGSFFETAVFRKVKITGR
jgi:hypothetical protein